MALALRPYKLQNGEANFPALLSVPLSERLPAMVEKDFLQATALVVAALGMAFETLSLKRTKSDIGVLINNIADEIIDTCGEDNLSVEDLVIFLKGFVKGEYGTSFDSMTVPKFMDMFEVFRQKRHEEMIQYRENKHLEFEHDQGHSHRTENTDPLSRHLNDYSKKLSELREDLREARHELKKQHNIDNF